MTRVLFAVLAFIILAAPNLASAGEKTSDINHKGYTTTQKEKMADVYEYDNSDDTKISKTVKKKKKVKVTYFNPAEWIDIKTDCKPCEALIKEYNYTVQNIFYTRTSIAQAKYLKTREGAEHIKNYYDGIAWRKGSEHEGFKIGGVLELMDINEQIIKDKKQILANYEALEKELKQLIADCEKQCKEGEEQKYIIKDAKAFTLPYDWQGPYTTSCPQKCQKIADYLNGYPDRTYPVLARKRLAQTALMDAKNSVKEDRMDFGAHIFGSTNDSEGDVYDAEADLKKVEKELETIKRKFLVDVKGLADCEKSEGCVPSEKKKTACNFPSYPPPMIEIGPKSEVGTTAELTNKVKDQAKGAAMGALGSVLGGSGLSLGGGGDDSASKGPKEVKDPTAKYGGSKSGTFDRIRLNFSSAFTGKDELVVSTEIEDSPGDGTFHAQWLEDGQGNIYLPKKYLILELYQDWKLTVWWDYKRWKDGELVQHDHGEEVSFGRNTKRLAVWFEEKKNAIWSTLGFGTATKGVKGLGSVFDIPQSAFAGGCPLRLVTHVSNPDKDPVTTTPAVTFIQPPEQADNDAYIGVLRTTFKF